MRSTCCAAALLWAWAALAYADERPLRIDEVVLVATDRPTRRVPLGGVVTLRGPDFLPRQRDGDPDDVRHLEVEIGGAPAIVLDARATAVTILVPQFDLRPGRRALTLRVKGRGTVRIDVEVVELADVELPGQDEAPATGERQAEHDRVTAGFGPTRFVFVHERGAFVARGAGGGLPAGMTLQVTLYAEGEPGERTRLGQRVLRLEPASSVRGRGRGAPAEETDDAQRGQRGEGQREQAGEAQREQAGEAQSGDEPTRWEVAFDVPPGSVTPGRYALDVLFELGRQTGPDARRYRATLSPIERDAWERVLRRIETQVEAAPR